MRRIFAILALFTGLAAVGAPVNAAVMGEVCQQVSNETDTQTRKASPCKCEEDRRTVPCKANTPQRPKSRATVVIFIPTVQFGADRAFE